MNELAESIVRIQHGEIEEYAVIIARFQDMAVGYAYAALGDLALAEDVAQEAFIAAYYTITARQPFPAGFGALSTPRSTENMTAAYRLAMMRVPDYDPMLDLIVVAPDGQWVAFCLAWFSQADNQHASQPIGWLDPIGTRPDFQHRGLAKALLLTGLALLKERGMTLASTNAASNNVAMQRAAASVGFRVKAQT